MRMWMTNPQIMCLHHLLGEHCECHMFLGTLKKRKSMTGYVRNNCFEPLKLKERHDVLAAELIRRGYNHKSPLDFSLDVLSYLPAEQIEYKIDCESSFQELVRRCNKCMNLSIQLIKNTIKEGCNNDEAKITNVPS